MIRSSASKTTHQLIVYCACRVLGRRSSVRYFGKVSRNESIAYQNISGFSIVEGLIATVILSVVVLVAISGSNYVVKGLSRAKDRSIADSAMNAEAASLRESISEFHYCGGEFLIADSDCNGESLGESNRYFPSTESDQAAFGARCEGDPSLMKSSLITLIEAIPTAPGISRQSVDVDNSTMLVTIVLADSKGLALERIVSFYPPVAAFCP